MCLAKLKQPVNSLVRVNYLVKGNRCSVVFTAVPYEQINNMSKFINVILVSVSQVSITESVTYSL